jgi:hypothetical protein
VRRGADAVRYGLQGLIINMPGHAAIRGGCEKEYARATGVNGCEQVAVNTQHIAFPVNEDVGVPPARCIVAEYFFNLVVTAAPAFAAESSHRGSSR